MNIEKALFILNILLENLDFKILQNKIVN